MRDSAPLLAKRRPPCYVEDVLTKIVVSNFRSLGENVEIPLGRLTVLVGINGAGKSSIIDAVRFVSECARDGVGPALIKRNGLGSIRRRANEPNLQVGFQVELKSKNGLGTASWAFDLREDNRGDYEVGNEAARWQPDMGEVIKYYLEQIRRDPDSPWRALIPQLEAEDASGLELFDEAMPQIVDRSEISSRYGMTYIDPTDLAITQDTLRRPLAKMLDFLRNIACYTIFPDQLRQPQKPDSVRRPMDEHGANWTTTLRRLSKDGAGKEFLAAMGRIVGDITDYRVQSVGGYLVTEFRHGEDRWLDASMESDGTLRIAGLLTALLQDPPLKLIGIEEPELTVHPGALPVFFDFLREASRRSQILLSTHSPELLDLLDPSEILIVSRDGTTQVAPMASDQIDLVKQHLLSTSDLLRAEGLRPQTEHG